MYGGNLSPFSYFFLDIIYITGGIGIIYGIYISLKNKPELRSPILFNALLPLFVSVFIIEPISLPMMTQLAPQHVIFLFPWVAFIFFQLWCFTKIGKIINILIVSGFLYAGYLNQTREYIDWEKIQNIIISNKIPIISDAPATCEFFLKNEITWFQYTEKVENIINTSDTISLTMTNWKNYQIIDSLQFWHNPKGTKQEYQSIKGIIKLLKKNKFSLINGYSFFPIHSYTFARNNDGEWAEPWFYDLKYGDLKVPLFIENKKIIGFEKIDLKQSVYFDSTFYYFIQTDNLNDSNHAIEITFMDSTKKKYKLAQEDDTFRSYYCRSIANDRIVHSFKKMPLVSNSMRYPGSMFNSEVRIFKHEEIEDIYTIKCSKPGLILIKAIVSDL